VNPQRRRWLATAGALPACVTGRSQPPTPTPCAAAGVMRCRATTARTPTPAPSGGTPPAGWARPAPSHGFQVTFFRSRTGLAQDLPGRLAPRQLLFAHAAVTDLAGRRHWHDQRIVRWNGDAPSAGPKRGRRIDARHPGVDRPLVAAARRRRLPQPGRQHRWRAIVVAGPGLRPSQPLLLQGDAGFSRKGPDERQASHYYSQPQLGAGHGHARRPAPAGQRPRLAGPRVERRDPGRRRRGLGLDRLQPASTAARSPPFACAAPTARRCGPAAATARPPARRAASARPR
jgi:hypothetical protein